MAAYRRVYDLHHLQADCQNRDQLRNPTLGNRVWATFTFLVQVIASKAARQYAPADGSQYRIKVAATVAVAL